MSSHPTSLLLDIIFSCDNAFFPPFFPWGFVFLSQNNFSVSSLTPNLIPSCILLPLNLWLSFLRLIFQFPCCYLDWVISLVEHLLSRGPEKSEPALLRMIFSLFSLSWFLSLANYFSSWLCTRPFWIPLHNLFVESNGFACNCSFPLSNTTILVFDTFIFGSVLHHTS